MVNPVRLSLELRDAGAKPRHVDLQALQIRLGRAPGNDLQLSDPRVSSMHGLISASAHGARYEDLGSTNGSAVIRQGRRCPVAQGQGGIELQIGDELLLGDADQPTSLKVSDIQVGTEQDQPAKLPAEVTVVAQRGLGQISLVPAGEQLQSLLRLLADLRSEQEPDKLIERVLRYLLSALPKTSQVECHLQARDGSMQPELALDAQSRPTAAMAPSSTLLQSLQSDPKALLLEDLQQAGDLSASLRRMPCRSLLIAPLLRDSRMVGWLQAGSRSGTRFDESDLDLLSVLADQLSAVFDAAHLIERLKEAEARLRGERDYLKRRLATPPAFEQMLGQSPDMQELRRQIRKVAPSRTTVLILGETGSGKELVARALHELSPRAQAAFAAVNCSSLASGLLESELFGHQRGAFTGAYRDHKGLFEVADGGSLLPDEVGDMPAELQPKLLRVLEEGQVLPVGANRPKAVDVRVVAATHHDLEARVSEGAFRRDLLFRLDVFTLRVPPLRRRQEDIPILAAHFLAGFAAEQGRPKPELDPDALAALQAHDWPGNIRELRNEMERAVLMAPHDGPVRPEHLSDKLAGGRKLETKHLRGQLKEVMERLEATVVSQALERHAGNRTRCAKELGISRQALIAKIAKLGLS